VDKEIEVRPGQVFAWRCNPSRKLTVITADDCFVRLHDSLDNKTHLISAEQVDQLVNGTCNGCKSHCDAPMYISDRA
jgi:hypothetical protein